MDNNDQLQDILKFIRQGALGSALSAMENYLLTYPSPKEQERLNRIGEDYRLMVDYWQRGYKDPQRQEVYQRLLQRLNMLATGMVVAGNIRRSPFVMSVYQRARASRDSWALTSVRSDLESFVSDQALIGLKPPHVRAAEERELFDRHQRLMSALFDYIWTSLTWSDNLGDSFIDLLLSPTVDDHDQELMASAITLSLLNCFDYQKWRVLVEVYAQTGNEYLRQRALVGWALAVDSRQLTVYPEMLTTLQKLLADDQCRQELKELQMQLVYCMKADEDSQKIQQEMIPEIIKNNDQFRVTRNGIEEIEEDPMEDILHPEASEQRMEKLEETMRKMVDMQRAGSDIYYGGFAQMKRFSFFNDTCNWLMPFYAKHPGLTQVMNDERRSRILLGLLRHSPFCDSDAYSFALGFYQAMDRLPKNMLELLDRGELSLIGELMDDDEIAQPAYVRRRYLQDLYRFYRLFPSRNAFVSPFESSEGRPRIFFFGQKVFRLTALTADCVEVAGFLAKQRLYRDAFRVLNNCQEEYKGERYYMTYAAVVQQVHATNLEGDLAIDSYRHVLKNNPQHEQALKGMARLLFANHDYQGALDAYEQLLVQHPDHHNFLLNKAVCLGNLQKYEEALKILYKMNYEQPDDQVVKRVLAWTVMCDGKLEQAGSLYSQLLDDEKPVGDDLLNAGLCRWLNSDVIGAAELFRQYAATCGENGFDAEAEFRREEALLRRHGIGDVEIRLMVDALRG